MEARLIMIPCLLSPAEAQVVKRVMQSLDWFGYKILERERAGAFKVNKEKKKNRRNPRLNELWRVGVHIKRGWRVVRE